MKLRGVFWVARPEVGWHALRHKGRAEVPTNFATAQALPRPSLRSERATRATSVACRLTFQI